jgi:4-hydroxybenzoate polyprenyltransferase
MLSRRRSHQVRSITDDGRVDVDSLPIRPEVAELIKAVRAAGDRVELVMTARDSAIAAPKCLLETFDDVITVPAGVGASPDGKAQLLRRRFPEGFAYVGNSTADLPIWRAAAERFAVNLSERARRTVTAENLGVVELATPVPVLPALLRSMRPHQWLKNMLLFVPLSLVLSTTSFGQIAAFVIAFLLLSFLTSGTYQINDLFDLEADRRHPRKCQRPIASGDLPLPVAAATSAAFVGIALIGSRLLDPTFFHIVVAYLLLTLAYSLRLKQEVLIDVITVATLFTLRILAGMEMLHQPPSPWLMMFSVFFFLGLALMKRQVELNNLAEAGAHIAHGRGYTADDRVFVASFGIACGVASLVVFALFVSAMTSQTGSNYSAPGLLWGAMALIGYWQARMWLVTSRGQMNDDPILYAARDRISLLIGATTAVVALAAQIITL